MGSLSIWHWAIVLIVVAVVFGGRGKLSGLMGDAAKGIKEFKNGLKDDDKPASTAETLTTPVVEQRERDKA